MSFKKNSKPQILISKHLLKQTTKNVKRDLDLENLFDKLDINDSYEYDYFNNVISNSKEINIRKNNPLLLTTNKILEYYKKVNNNYLFEEEMKPKKILTIPSDGIGNDGRDNINYDLIVNSGDVFKKQGTGIEYRVVDILGEGVSGQVFKVVLETLKESNKINQDNECSNIEYALKVIKNKRSFSVQSLIEIKLLDIINKKIDPEDKFHFIRKIDNFVFHNHVCIIFELFHESLFDLIKQSYFKGTSLLMTKFVCKKLLEGVAKLHSNEIIHCDLKPENILLKISDNDIHIKITDFGSACEKSATIYTYIQSRHYRAPEVIIGNPYSFEIDIWSVGCIAAELFLGVPLFAGKSEYEHIYKIHKFFGNLDLPILNYKKYEKYFNKNGSILDQEIYYSKYPEDKEQPDNNINEFENFAHLEKYCLNNSSKTKNNDKSKLEVLEFLDLLKKMLTINPKIRITAKEALNHSFFNKKKPSKIHNENKYSFKKRNTDEIKNQSNNLNNSFLPKTNNLNTSYSKPISNNLPVNFNNSFQHNYNNGVYFQNNAFNFGNNLYSGNNNQLNHSNQINNLNKGNPYLSNNNQYLSKNSNNNFNNFNSTLNNSFNKSSIFNNFKNHTNNKSEIDQSTLGKSFNKVLEPISFHHLNDSHLYGNYYNNFVNNLNTSSMNISNLNIFEKHEKQNNYKNNFDTSFNYYGPYSSGFNYQNPYKFHQEFINTKNSDTNNPYFYQDYQNFLNNNQMYHFKMNLNPSTEINSKVLNDNLNQNDSCYDLNISSIPFNIIKKFPYIKLNEIFQNRCEIPKKIKVNKFFKYNNPSNNKSFTEEYRMTLYPEITGKMKIENNKNHNIYHNLSSKIGEYNNFNRSERLRSLSDCNGITTNSTSNNKLIKDTVCTNSEYKSIIKLTNENSNFSNNKSRPNTGTKKNNLKKLNENSLDNSNISNPQSLISYEEKKGSKCMPSTKNSLSYFDDKNFKIEEINEYD